MSLRWIGWWNIWYVYTTIITIYYNI